MDLPHEVPVMTLSNAILFPQAMLPLYIFEPRYRQMLKDALLTHRMFSVAMQKPGRRREIPSPIAGLGLIRVSVGNKDGTSYLVLQGVARVKLAELVRCKPYRVHRISPLETIGADTVAVDALTAKVLELVAERLEQGFEFPAHILKQFGHLIDSDASQIGVSALQHLMKHLIEIKDPAQLADLISCTLLPNPRHRQTILEAVNLEKRLRYLVQFLMNEIRRGQQSDSL